MVGTHGHAERDNHSRTYDIWRGMKDRCNPGNNNAEKYGDKGIDYDPRWVFFENFLADMGPCPDGLTLDRIENHKGYGPDNCRWATRKEQCRNRTTNFLITHDGKTQCLQAWADELGIKPHTIRARIKSYGWSVQKALSAPVRSKLGY